MKIMNTTFDQLEIDRPELAKNYVQLLTLQLGRPIALFAPRRVGKTFFLDNDLAPIAKRQGFVPVYADVWLHKTSPLDAINHALEEALDDQLVPTSATGRAAKTIVKKVGALGTSLEFGDEPRRRPLPTEPALRLDSLVTRLAQTSGKRVLLMLDEIQALGELATGDSIVASLRAVLQKRKREVCAVFTGSSQEALSSMMSASGGPMYQFAQLLDFPTLGEEYVRLLSEHFTRIHPSKQLNNDDLMRVFVYLGYKPALLKDLVKSMSAEGMTDIELALRRMTLDEKHRAGWRALTDSLSPLERAVLGLLAQGFVPLGQAALAQLKQNTPTVTLAKIRVALDKLKTKGIVGRLSGRYVIEDRMFALFLL
jgi:uncharacterized protein